MKNKEICAVCKYRGTVGARDIANADNVSCDYAGVTGRTALGHGKGGEAFDKRGDDFNVCLLFEEGDAIGRAGSEDFKEHVTIKSKRRAKSGD